MNKYAWKIGQTYVFSVPPGWVLGGTVFEVFEDFIVLQDAVYFEGIKDGASAMGSYPTATTVAELEKASARNWPLADGYLLNVGFISHASPAKMSFERVAKRDKVNALKGA